MSIFDVFTFKKEGRNIFSKETFSEVLGVARQAIIDQAKKNIPGVEKKNAVDVKVISRITSIEANCSNGIIRWVIERIIDVIPTVTQFIYDRLKEKVENL